MMLLPHIRECIIYSVFKVDSKRVNSAHLYENETIRNLSNIFLVSLCRFAFLMLVTSHLSCCFLSLEKVKEKILGMQMLQCDRSSITSLNTNQFELSIAGWLWI